MTTAPRPDNLTSGHDSLPPPHHPDLTRTPHPHPPPHAHSTASIDSVLEQLPALPRIMKRRAGLLSGGEQQMLALACALTSDPRLLMVDEMSHGLAPVIVEQLLPTLRSVADRTGMAVLLAQQPVHTAPQIAARACVLHRRRLLLPG